MARPVTRRPSVRVQVAPPPSAPQLDVAAPSVVRTPPPMTGGLGGLLQALGIASGVVAKNQEARQQQDFAQGQADEKLGKADQARANRSRAYADGAYQVAIIEQYHAAEQKVAARAASDELDKSRPLDEQTAIVDGWMKSELGPLIADPRAKTLIAERYQQFIDTFAGNVLKGQAEANANAAEDAATRDISAQLERTGTFNWDEQFHRLYSQTGDATRSNALLVGVVAQQIEDAATRGEDYSHLRELIPSEVIGPNGEKLPGPMYSPKYRGIINTAMARAEDLRNHALSQQFATQEYHARTKLDEDLANGVPITEDSIAAYGYSVGTEPNNTLSPALAAQYIQASRAALAKKNEESSALEGALEARRLFGRWKDVTGMPGAPATEEATQKMYDGWVQMVLTGSGAPIESIGGTGLIADPNLVATVANLSAQEGMPYGPLKRTLSGVSQAAPGDLMQRMDAYKVLKAKGVVGDYVDDDAALMYEVAIGAQEAGEKADGIAERVRTMGDKATHEYVAFNMPKVNRVRKTGFDIPTGSGLLGLGEVRSTRAINAGYVATKYERLAASALAKGLPVEEAQKYAQERITTTHVALNIDGKWAVLPKSAVRDPKVATEALDWYSQELPALAKKLDIPTDEPLQIMPRFDLNGRGLSFEVQRQGGVQTGVTFTLEGLVATYRRRFPPKDMRAEAVRRSEQFRKANTTPLSDPNANINPATRPGRE